MLFYLWSYSRKENLQQSRKAENLTAVACYYECENLARKYNWNTESRCLLGRNECSCKAIKRPPVPRIINLLGYVARGICSSFNGNVVYAFYCSLQRIGTILLVLHFIPEVFLSLGKLCQFAEKDPVAVWLFRVGNIVFILSRFLSFTFAVLTFWFGLEPYAPQALR